MKICLFCIYECFDFATYILENCVKGQNKKINGGNSDEKIR